MLDLLKRAILLALGLSLVFGTIVCVSLMINDGYTLIYTNLPIDNPSLHRAMTNATCFVVFMLSIAMLPVGLFVAIRAFIGGRP